MSEEQKISHLHTSCRNCVFAKYEGNTQVGCDFDRINKYKNAEVEILEARDDSKEFYLINGRLCLFYRNSGTMEKYAKDKWKEIVELQTKMPYQAIVFIEPETKMSELLLTLRSLKNQQTKPNIVTVVNKQYYNYSNNPEKYIKPSAILNSLQDFEFYKYNLKNITNIDLDDRELIDLVFDSNKKYPMPFYAVFRSGFKVPENYSDEMNDAFLTRMLQVGFVKPVDDLNGMFVNKVTHLKYSGNSFSVNLEDKILKFEENGSNFIFEAAEVFPCLV